MSTLPTPPFATLLRRARRAAGLTQEALAARAGLSVDAISALERGLTRAPHADTVDLLARALHLSEGERAAWEQATLGLRLPSDDEAPVLDDASQPLALHELPTGTVTFLFTDIEGSTRLLQQLGPAYAQALGEHQALLRAAFTAHGGVEVDTQGDAFFVAFATAPEAVLAACEATHALAEHAWPQNTTLRVRMGLHTGTPQVVGDHYVGLDVHRAARIAAAGHGGQVLLSQTTRALVEHTLPGGVTLRELGAHRLKDLQQPERLAQLVLPALPADFPPLKTLDTHPNNLPIQPTPFIGREREVAALAGQLARPEVRLLTLTGAAGVGKTRLALQVAAEVSDGYADGVFVVPLAPVTDPEQVMEAIAQVLAIPDVSGPSLLSQVQRGLKAKQLLLLLDNFEQVAAAALMVAELLAACPALKIMATSRVALHVRAEHEFAVPPLSLPDLKRLPDLVTLAQYEAVALFIERAQAVKADFAVTHANAPAVAGICARLDGLPLAIELAAARSKIFPPQALLTRLEQGLSVLAGGARDLPARQQTLRGAIAWSYHLLSLEEQQLFRRLAIFVDGCTYEASEAVCGAAGGRPADLLEGLASLGHFRE